MLRKQPPWICCQLGARRHYSVPRALHQTGQLIDLITDAWISPQVLPPFTTTLIPFSPLTRLCQRFHVELSKANVHDFTASLIRFELTQRIQKNSGWEHVIARNSWFQQNAVELLDSISRNISSFDSRPILFAYSYAALQLFSYAKSQGWRTILGQIDPGPVEENIVREEHHRHPEYKSRWQAAPAQYWDAWRKECSLADRIIVSSPWSSQALQQVGIPAKQIDIIPLAYNPPKQARTFERKYPQAFSVERPLRVLFLGQVILRKGLTALLEAAELLHDQPIEFWLVGSEGIARSSQAVKRGQVRWIGSVPRGSTAKYYQQADVFLFPTLSDGFGITQLEAQAWKLPIIASKFCGEVVKNQENGFLLQEVTGNAIAEILQLCLRDPQKLEYLSQSSAKSSYDFNLLHLQNRLLSLSDSF